MKNFYLIYGTNKSQISKKIEELKTKLNVSEIIKYSLDKDNLEDIILDASLVNMFSNIKLILVSDANIFATSKKDINTKPLEDYFDNYNSDTYIIFVCEQEKVDTRKKIYKKIKEHGEIIEITKTSKLDIKKFILNTLKQNEYTIENIDYLSDKIGTNIDNAENELNKLMIFKMDEKNISNNDIDKLIIPSLEDEIFALSDAVIKNETKRSLDLLEEFINKNYDEMQIIILLASSFRFMYQVKHLSNKNMSSDMIAKELSANPYRVKINLKNCYYYNEDDLLSYIKKLADLDKNIKLGLIDKNLGLQLFLMNKNYKGEKK